MQTSPLVLVCAADDRFAMPLAVTFYSALANLDDREHILLVALDVGMSEGSRRRVERMVRPYRPRATLEWIQPEQRLLDELAANQHLPIASCARLLIPRLLPGKIEKAIYLDSDTLVVSDLSRLWNEEMNGYSHLAVQDLGQPFVSSSHKAVPDYEALGLAADAKYFNAGVMIMNLRKWRDESTSKKVLEYIRSRDPESLRFLDQNGLNAVLAGQWGEVDPRWNQMHGIYEYASWKESPYDSDDFHNALERPHVIHYTYTGKPWRAGCRHPWTRPYLRYLKASGWFSPMEWFMWRTRNRLETLARRVFEAVR